MVPGDETFDGTWPYVPRYGEAAGFRRHYVDEGPERPEHTLVLLHGEPTRGYEWRHLIGPLSRRNRAIVPDHMGFGKSATPPDRGYLLGGTRSGAQAAGSGRCGSPAGQTRDAVEGMRDAALMPRHMIPAFRLAYPDAPVIELPEAGHFTPEDAPETLLALLQLFLQTSTRV